ncbi:MAG: hypothetical protein HY939_07015 [Gammaproteobacteria bacterium]|nr:hypothetical protein [Gammaproteobacteria bacterium]
MARGIRVTSIDNRVSLLLDKLSREEKQSSMCDQKIGSIKQAYEDYCRKRAVQEKNPSLRIGLLKSNYEQLILITLLEKAEKEISAERISDFRHRFS